jgi:hypothetical protein
LIGFPYVRSVKFQQSLNPKISPYLSPTENISTQTNTQKLQQVAKYPFTHKRFGKGELHFKAHATQKLEFGTSNIAMPTARFGGLEACPPLED